MTESYNLSKEKNDEKLDKTYLVIRDVRDYFKHRNANGRKVKEAHRIKLENFLGVSKIDVKI